MLVVVEFFFDFVVFCEVNRRFIFVFAIFEFILDVLFIFYDCLKCFLTKKTSIVDVVIELFILLIIFLKSSLIAFSKIRLFENFCYSQWLFKCLKLKFSFRSKLLIVEWNEFVINWSLWKNFCILSVVIVIAIIAKFLINWFSWLVFSFLKVSNFEKISIIFKMTICQLSSYFFEIVYFSKKRFQGNYIDRFLHIASKLNVQIVVNNNRLITKWF